MSGQAGSVAAALPGAAALPLGELAERIAALRRALRQAQGEEATGALRAELAALEQALLARRPPPSTPRPRSPLEAARELADVCHFEVPPSHRRALGRVVTAAKRAWAVGLRPLHVAALRPQARFNLALVETLEGLVSGALPRGGGASLRAAPEPLAAPAGEGALPASPAVRALLRAHLTVLGPLLARQAEWNRRALALAEVAAREELPAVEEANRLVATLAEVGDPTAGPGLPRAVRALGPLLREVLRRQVRFNTEVMLALSDVLHGRPPVAAPTPSDYLAWYEEREPAQVERARAALAGLTQRPLISLVVPAWETPPDVLRACLDSVRAQLYGHWELCVVDDGSRSRKVRRTLEAYARRDPRIRWTRLERNGGIAAATNAAIDMARGEWIAFLDHDDTLAPHALAEVALRLAREPGVDWLYTDEDRISVEGTRDTPFFKPGWSPDLLRSLNYVCHFVVARASLVKELQLREGYQGSQDYDFLLRLSERTGRVAHVPGVLYHWRRWPSSLSQDTRKLASVSAAGARALREHLERCGEAGEVTEVAPGHYRVRYPVQGQPLVSIIVPFKDRPELLERLTRTLLERTRYPHYELLLVSNASVQPRTYALLDALDDPRIRKLRWDEPFNYPAINNFAARHARGELLLFLNNDMEVVDGRWLEELIGHAQRPGVGSVGPKLLFPDGSIQHAGVVVGIGGYAGHPFWRFPDTQFRTPFGHADWDRNYLAVTSACVMLRREVFEALGGYDERFRVVGSDVDLGIRLAQRGLRTVYTAGTWLYHHESASRRTDALPEDDLWESVVTYRPFLEEGDPFYNPHLSLRAPDCDLRREEASGLSLALEPLTAYIAARGGRE